MTTNLVIVESPAKAKTINKYLGQDFHVLASYGHVRDLPSKDGSVEPDREFAMHWDTDAKSAKRLKEIADAAKKADRLILATDPDREGEAISWHVLEVLRKKGVLKDKPIERVVFNAITSQAVNEAMASPRAIDDALVDAYLARRALDYLVGFTLSPVLWRKLPGARSAGRVQSVALRLVCEREAEIEAFKPIEYWSVGATVATPSGDSFETRLVAADGDKIDRHGIRTEAEAGAFKRHLEQADLAVSGVETKPVKRNPPPPFTTSTMQQEASRKLGFSAARTMQVAQRLYEGVNMGGETQGLITYMRTDGVQMANEAIAAVRDVIGREHGSRYVPDAPRIYKTKAKNAQEAHEAIRPTDPGRTPRDVERFLEPEQAKLYALIWKRALASQMQSADLERTTVDIAADHDGRRLGLRATGQVVRFDGFLALYQEGRDDDQGEDGARLPPVDQGMALTRRDVTANQHFTEPPPRYTEATLIKKMEELGIGRPSTYTATLQTLVNRDYVHIDKRRLIPEDKGRLVTAFLESFFTRYVQYDFTADLEEKLDRISNNEIGWKDVLSEFWRDFTGTVDEIKDLRVAEVLEALNEILGEHVFPDTGNGDPRACPSCAGGRLSLKVGKFGAFIGCSNYPDCRFTRQLTPGDGDGSDAKDNGPKVLGTDPDTGLDVSLRDGRFGPYLQLGEGADGEKPKRTSVPKGQTPSDIDLEMALRLLSLPREVGLHPETGKPISAGIGRYGPFVEHERVYANLDSVDDVLTVGLNRAVALLAEKASKSRAPTTLRELGQSADGKSSIVVKQGRYGPYVTDGKTNATLPKSADPQAVTLDEALELIAAKQAKGKGSKAKGAKAKTTKAKPRKRAAAE